MIQSYECPSCESIIEIKEETDITDFNCPFCSQRCELEFIEDDGISGEYWYIIKME